MLKIKKDFDLKGLERFGFFDMNSWRKEKYPKDYYPEYSCGKFTVQKNRNIRSRAGNQYNGLDSLFDLIQAGIVEKVEEK